MYPFRSFIFCHLLGPHFTPFIAIARGPPCMFLLTWMTCNPTPLHRCRLKVNSQFHGDSVVPKCGRGPWCSRRKQQKKRAMKKGEPWLFFGFMGDEMLPSYTGIISQAIIRIPRKVYYASPEKGISSKGTFIFKPSIFMGYVLFSGG